MTFYYFEWPIAPRLHLPETKKEKEHGIIGERTPRRMQTAQDKSQTPGSADEAVSPRPFSIPAT
jgi:hypothetical protein